MIPVLSSTPTSLTSVTDLLMHCLPPLPQDAVAEGADEKDVVQHRPGPMPKWWARTPLLDDASVAIMIAQLPQQIHITTTVCNRSLKTNTRTHIHTCVCTHKQTRTCVHHLIVGCSVERVVIARARAIKLYSTTPDGLHCVSHNQRYRLHS